ncbi:aminotransferase class IV [Streptomyces sp. NPDC060031]|uniref:aminotransferase class IV n=1 Tax=Streptomyces sp. NPDC060031 TaxID=3347043 RepID=UPI0036BA37F3
MTQESGHAWLPAVAVSRCVGSGGGDCDGLRYDRPTLRANEVGSLAEFSADGIQFGFSVFEGMRAYLADPAFLVFRARDHHDRLRASCTALALPCPAYDVFVEAIESAVRANWDAGAARSLYVRPVVFAAGGDIMPQRNATYVFAVLVKRFDPVVDAEGIGVLVEGGTPRTHPVFASVKTAANYTSSALAMRDAQAAGYDTLLWLDGDGHLQECTTMNVFLWLDGRFVTPKLGSILPGITRRTVMDLLAGMGEPVLERDIHISEVADALARAADLSMFTTSTALGVRNVARLRLGSADHVLDGKAPSAWSRVEEQYVLVTERFMEADDSYAAITSRSQIGSK